MNNEGPALPINWILPALALGVTYALLLPRVRNAQFCRATVTPLASIIGSGFLVVAPLLAKVVGINATWAILGIVVIAYAIGAVIRFNIRYAEPLLVAGNHSLLNLTERLSNAMLTIAYVISVGFYVRLLAAFLLKSFGSVSVLAANIVTTVILASIGMAGWYSGFRGLERLEEWAVAIKLAIITALLIALLQDDLVSGFGNGALLAEKHSLFESIQMLAGMLLVVQGFETSRYLGNEFTAQTRINSMRLAQLLSAAIYVGFVALIMPLLHLIPPTTLTETAIIDLVGQIAFILPMMLVIAAIMSQFSAAIADTLGAGGLILEVITKNVTSRASYLIVVGSAIGLIWMVDIFEIVTLASRTFALYYFVQVLVAVQAARHDGALPYNVYRYIGFTSVALVLLWIVVFAIPVQ
ncbi:MAG: hypothetical protein ACJAY7_000131 [Pseudohongiellaceae bacterium]|jgi:hypothetical protein